MPSVDETHAEFLCEGQTLGAALAALEQHLREATQLLRALANDSVSDSALVEALDEWNVLVQGTLIDMFRSAAPLLRFVTNRPLISVSPPRANLRGALDHAIRGLLGVLDDLLAQRESIATAAHELAVRMATHQELVSEIRNTRGMTEDLWAKMQSERMVSPYLRRLLDLGVAQ